MLDSYCILNQKIKKHITLFPIFVTIISTFLLLLLNKIKVPVYLEGTAIIDYETNLLFKISIPQSKLYLLQNHNQIIINQKKYNYQIKEIKEIKIKDKILVYLFINLEEKDLKEKYEIKYKIEITKMNFFEYVWKN